MDYHVYSFYAKIVFCFLLICLFVLIITKCATKRPESFLLSIIIICCSIGLYLTSPALLYTLGYEFGNLGHEYPQLLKAASKMTLLKEERCELYKALFLCYQNIEKSYADGNLSIEYSEKCKNDGCSIIPSPVYLYFIKGDYDKVLEIEKLRNEIVFTPEVYILKEQYENALNAFATTKEGRELPFPSKKEMLISAIYKKLGDEENYKKSFDFIHFKLFNYFDKLYPNNKNLSQEKGTEFLRMKAHYLDLDLYRANILEQRKLLKFD